MTPQFKKLVWTEHSKIKMRQYGLSKQKLLGVLRKPERKEKAIVQGLIAVMKTNPPPHKATARQSKILGEIWLMYKDIKSGGLPERKIISAWRYPGVTKPGEAIPVPEDIKNFVESGIME
jgi:hypothetical protein